jgi:hypothetical protein
MAIAQLNILLDELSLQVCIDWTRAVQWHRGGTGFESMKHRSTASAGLCRLRQRQSDCLVLGPVLLDASRRGGLSYTLRFSEGVTTMSTMDREGDVATTPRGGLRLMAYHSPATWN